LFAALAQLARRRARVVIGVAGLVALLAAALGASVADRLVPYSAENPSSGSVKAREIVEHAGGFDPRAGMIALVSTPSGVRSESGRRRVRRVARVLDKTAHVARVTTFFDTRERAYVSRDRRSTYVIANFEPVSARTRQDTAERVKERLERHSWVSLGGVDTTQTEINSTAEEDLARAELIAFPALLLLGLWFFRGLVAALMPVLVGVLTVVLTFAALRVASELTDVSVFSLNLVTGLSLGLAIDYSLFILYRYREELKEGESHHDALDRTLATAGRTVLYSSITVAGALASLLIFPENFLFSMGVAGVMVPLLAASAALVVLPAVLSVLGPRIDALAPPWLQRRARSEAQGDRSGAWFRIARFVMARPVAVAVASAGVLLVLGMAALNTKFILADARVLPAEAGSRQVNDALLERFPPNPSGAMFVALDGARAADAKRLARRIAKLPGAAAVERPQRIGRRAFLVDVVPRGDPLSERSKRLVERVRDLDSRAVFEVGGESARFVDQESSLSERIPYAILIVLAATILVIFLLTGSLVLPVKSFVMNVLTLCAAFGILVLVFQEGRLEGLLDYTSPGALDLTQPILVCALVFGLSTDYGVFLLSRIKEAHEAGHTNRDAVALGIERTGRIVTAAALMFCVAVIVFTTSKIVFVKEIGVGTALAVLIDATIVRALLVPALMELLGDRNWWAPPPLRRLVERLDLAERGPATPPDGRLTGDPAGSREA
jgi:uncharacterized membrane protein YdfJ with MMPL/SSD domain